MNPDTINEFVKFYVETFNNKTRFAEFITMWKEYSTFVINGVSSEKTLLENIKNLYAYTIKCDQSTDIIMSFTLNGTRRANILLSYQILDNAGNILNISQFILLAYSNNNEFWIHSNIINMK
jgi:hypothetical protein